MRKAVLGLAALIALCPIASARTVDMTKPHPDMLLPVIEILPGGKVAVMCCCPPEWERIVDGHLFCSVPWHIVLKWKEEGRQ